MRNLTISALTMLLIAGCAKGQDPADSEAVESQKSTVKTSDVSKSTPKPQSNASKSNDVVKTESLTGVYSVDIKVANDAPTHPGKLLKNEIVIYPNKKGGYAAYVETKSPAKGTSCGLDKASVINENGNSFTIKHVNKAFSFTCELDYKLDENSLVLTNASEGCEDFCGLLDPFKFKSPPLMKTCERPNLKEMKMRADDHDYEEESTNSLCLN